MFVLVPKAELHYSVLVAITELHVLAQSTGHRAVNVEPWWSFPL